MRQRAEPAVQNTGRHVSQDGPGVCTPSVGIADAEIVSSASRYRIVLQQAIHVVVCATPVMAINDGSRIVTAAKAHRRAADERVDVIAAVERAAYAECWIEVAECGYRLPSERESGPMDNARRYVAMRRKLDSRAACLNRHRRIVGVVEQDPATEILDRGFDKAVSDAIQKVGRGIAIVARKRHDVARYAAQSFVLRLCKPAQRLLDKANVTLLFGFTKQVEGPVGRSIVDKDELPGPLCLHAGQCMQRTREMLRAISAAYDQRDFHGSRTTPRGPYRQAHVRAGLPFVEFANDRTTRWIDLLARFHRHRHEKRPNCAGRDRLRRASRMPDATTRSISNAPQRPTTLRRRRRLTQRMLRLPLLSKHDALRFVAENASLFDEAGRTNPFVCSAWMLNFIEEICSEDDTFVVAESAGASRGLIFLRSASASPRRLSCVANYYSSLYSSVIAPADRRESLLPELIDALTEARPRFDVINFSPLESSECRDLSVTLARRGWFAKQYFCFGNWHLPVSFENFDAYLATRPSQVRNTIKRKAKKFRDAGGRLQIVRTGDEVPSAIAAFEAVYAKSWKRPEPFPAFVPRWAGICAQNGWLRLGLAWLGDTPIAAQFWFTKDRHSFIFKLGYDEAHASWSAGTLLTAHLMRGSIDEDRVVEIDYLTGDDAYKRSWMSERRERLGVRACNLRSWRGRMSAAYESLAAMRRRKRAREPAADARDAETRTI